MLVCESKFSGHFIFDLHKTILRGALLPPSNNPTTGNQIFCESGFHYLTNGLAAVQKTHCSCNDMSERPSTFPTI